MPNCGCASQTCGCKISNGAGTSVSGTGTVKDPYVIRVDSTSLNLGASIQVSNSNTVEFSKLGTGGSGDPIVISGTVILRSPDNSRWAPSITNAGVVSWAKL